MDKPANETQPPKSEETKKELDPIELQITCPEHPNEFIERICTDSTIEKDLVCIECLLNFDDPAMSSSALQTVEEFVDSAAKFYEKSKIMTSEPSEQPQEITELSEKQGEYIDKIQKNIVKEKAKIEERFKTLIEEFTKVCNTKKMEYISTLDKQLANYRCNYIYFEKQARKLYPTENLENQTNLYPTQEEIIHKLHKITNSTQLLAFIKNIKQDLNEAKYNPLNQNQESIEEIQKKNLSSLSKALESSVKNIPQYINTKNYTSDKVIKDIKEILDKSLSKFLDLQHEILDLTKGETMPQSKILTNPEQLNLLKKWLKKDVLNLKLLYRGSKDGFTGNAFHNKCNNKNETITLIKTQTGNKIFGGYLDKPWQTKEAWITSSNVFIFSLTNKEKYKLIAGNENYGAYCGASYGPSFGGGYDFHLNGQSGGCLKHSFEIPDVNSFAGGSAFTASEVEVFQITKEPVGLSSGGLSGSGGGNSKDKAIPQEAKKKVADYLGVTTNEFKLVYKGSEHGMNPETFHSKCDGLGPTVVFVKSKDDTLGGYTTQPWSQKEIYSSDFDAFVFSISKDLFCPVSIGESATFQSSTSGAYFGDEETLVVFKEKQNGKWNVISNGYDCYQDGSTFSGGHFSFIPEEVEVYEIPL